MTNQSQHWSKAATSYEKEFIDPYLPDIRNPLRKYLRKLGDRSAKVVADLGCGIGPLLPFLAEHFRQVFAVDFAPGMLARAKVATKGHATVAFVCASLMELQLPEPVDVAVAVNRFVMPDAPHLE